MNMNIEHSIEQHCAQGCCTLAIDDEDLCLRNANRMERFGLIIANFFKLCVDEDHTSNIPVDNCNTLCAVRMRVASTASPWEKYLM